MTTDWSYKPLQDLEEMNRQLLAELDVSSLDSSPHSTPSRTRQICKTTQKTGWYYIKYKNVDNPQNMDL